MNVPKILELLMGRVRVSVFLLLPVLLGSFVLLILYAKAKELTGKKELFPLGIFLVLLTLSSMAINVLRAFPADYDKEEKRRFLEACIDLFLASILTALSALAVWITSLPEVISSMALVFLGLTFLHWLLLTVSLFLFLWGMCVILGVLRRMHHHPAKEVAGLNRDAASLSTTARS